MKCSFFLWLVSIFGSMSLYAQEFMWEIQVHTGQYSRIHSVIETRIDFPEHDLDDFVTEVYEKDFPSNPVLHQLDMDGKMGHLTFLLSGETPAHSIRNYIFRMKEDRRSSNSKISRVEMVVHEGQETYKIPTENATYFYHQFGSGFASMDDKDGNDWLSYNPGEGAISHSGSGGKFRGIPNMGHPEGYCHPGNTVSKSEILAEGPMKVSILSESNDGKMQCRWDIFPTFARMTLLTMRTPYWFLYEGTPGGTLDMEEDYCVRSDGTRTRVSEKWEGDIPSPDGHGEWLYFGDEKSSRVLYLIHATDDEGIDSYWPMNEEMTVFGFGRLGLKKFMETVPDKFYIGFYEENEYNKVKEGIESVYQPIQVTVKIK